MFRYLFIFTRSKCVYVLSNLVSLFSGKDGAAQLYAVVSG